MFSEPAPVKKIYSVDFDIALQSKVKAIPEGFTKYDKIVVEGPMTLS